LDDSLVREIISLAEKTGDKDVLKTINSKLASGEVNKSNLASFRARLKDLIKQKETEDNE
jgi:hypothetical protein